MASPPKKGSRSGSASQPENPLAEAFLPKDHVDAIAPPVLQIQIDGHPAVEEAWTSPTSMKLTIKDAQLLDWDHSTVLNRSHRAPTRLSSEFEDGDHEAREDLTILLDPYYDVTTGRMRRMFKFFSPKGEEKVSYEQFQQGLVALGINCPEKVDFSKLIKKIDTDRDGTISLDEFIHVVQMIKLAHLFKPESLEEGLRLNASFHVADYSPTNIHSVEHVKNIQNFMFSTKPSWAKVRWVHLAGISDSNDLHLRRLAIKYQFHPLALEDCMKKSDKIRCKYERYEDHTFIVIPVLKPIDVETATYMDFCIKRHQATLFEKDLAFVDGWKKSAEKPDIDNLRAMLEKLEQLMRKPQQLCIFMDTHNNVISVQEENDTDGNAGFRIWNQIYDNNMSKSYSKIRNHGPNFLVVSLLDAIVDDILPLVQIFEVIINTMESLQVAQGRDFDTKRIFLAKKQLVVIEKVVRPMLDLVEGQLLEQEEFSKGEDKNYLRDVKDHLKQMVNDVKEHQASLSVIFNEDQQARAKAQADVQFTISVVAAIFLPATFMTGLYGMNFDNMPELHTENGYFVWWGVLGFISLMIVLFFKMYKKWI